MRKILISEIGQLIFMASKNESSILDCVRRCRRRLLIENLELKVIRLNAIYGKMSNLDAFLRDENLMIEMEKNINKNYL